MGGGGGDGRRRAARGGGALRPMKSRIHTCHMHACMHACAHRPVKSRALSHATLPQRAEELHGDAQLDKAHALARGAGGLGRHALITTRLATQLTICLARQPQGAKRRGRHVEHGRRVDAQLLGDASEGSSCQGGARRWQGGGGGLGGCHVARRMIGGHRRWCPRTIDDHQVDELGEKRPMQPPCTH